MISGLLRLATRLDELGHHDLADRLDGLNDRFAAQRMQRVDPETEALRAEMSRLHLNEGLSNRKVGEALGVTEEEVRKQLRAHLQNHPEMKSHPSYKKRRTPEELLERAKLAFHKYHDEKKDMETIAWEMGTSPGNVYKLLNRKLPADLSTNMNEMRANPPPGRRITGPRPDTMTLIEQMGKLWMNNNYRPEQIRQKINLEQGRNLSIHSTREYLETYRGMHPELSEQIASAPPFREREWVQEDVAPRPTIPPYQQWAIV